MSEDLLRLAEAVPFVEQQCAVGGDLCEAWSNWFWTLVEAGPACNDEDRDPTGLVDYPFEPRHCLKIGTCGMHAAALRARASIGKGE